MRVAFYDTHGFEKKVFEEKRAEFGVELDYLDLRLTAQSAAFAKGYDAVCSFVNDRVDAACLQVLKEGGVKLVALRSAGFNHVDLVAARELGIRVVRVPGYSPNAVAEYTLGMLLCLNRKIHKAYARVKELNFSLDGLMGFDLYQKKVGVIGTGKIGAIFARSVAALGCEVLAFDKYPDPALEQQGIRYVALDELQRHSDVISLHVPLTAETRHLINGAAIERMKDGVFIINTGRGALIDSRALIQGLKARKIGGVALDVYEEEEEIFFQDLSERGLSDDVLARLLTFPNVLVSSHQAFLTYEALANIAGTTLDNLRQFSRGTVQNEVRAP